MLLASTPSQATGKTAWTPYIWDLNLDWKGINIQTPGQIPRNIHTDQTKGRHGKNLRPWARAPRGLRTPLGRSRWRSGTRRQKLKYRDNLDRDGLHRSRSRRKYHDLVPRCGQASTKQNLESWQQQSFFGRIRFRRQYNRRTHKIQQKISRQNHQLQPINRHPRNRYR